MTQNGQSWDELGKIIGDTVDRAINSRDFQQLNQSIRQTVDRAVNMHREKVSGSAPTAIAALFGNKQRRSVRCGAAFIFPRLGRWVF